MEILKCLENNQLINSYDIIDFKDFGNGYYLKIKVILIDNSELYINEYIDENERNYSYHWQSKDSEMIRRWDNAPHYQDIITFPHHVHFHNSVNQNYSITCSDIFNEISKILNKQ